MSIQLGYNYKDGNHSGVVDVLSNVNGIAQGIYYQLMPDKALYRVDHTPKKYVVEMHSWEPIDLPLVKVPYLEEGNWDA